MVLNVLFLNRGVGGGGEMILVIQMYIRHSFVYWLFACTHTFFYIAFLLPS